jgi:enoyl-CoA hydratase/carnithine racemase
MSSVSSLLAEGPPALETVDGVATLSLRRPSQRNLLIDEDLHRLLEIFAELNDDLTIRVLVLRAETVGQRKPVFCSGYNLGGFSSVGHDPCLFEKIPDALEALRPVTICALSGSVYGGATDLVLACDLRVGLLGTEFRMPATTLGLHYYPSGLRRYVSIFGLSAAKRAFLTGRAVPIEKLGALFESLLPASELEEAVKDLAKTVAKLAPLATQATKQSLNEIATGAYVEARLRDRERKTLGSADFIEGRDAFAHKRMPHFIGS